jgi:hypothetical protein
MSAHALYFKNKNQMENTYELKKKKKDLRKGQKGKKGGKPRGRGN